MPTGTVKFFNADKGYGFIQPDDARFQATLRAIERDLRRGDDAHASERKSLRPQLLQAGQHVVEQAQPPGDDVGLGGSVQPSAGPAGQHDDVGDLESTDLRAGTCSGAGPTAGRHPRSSAA